MAKRSDHSGGTALKTRPRAGRIVLWVLLAALLLGAVIGVVSLLRRPSGAETPENTAAVQNITAIAASRLINRLLFFIIDSSSFFTFICLFSFL